MSRFTLFLVVFGVFLITTATNTVNAIDDQVSFTAEGTARKYLRINGQWQDHLLFAIVAGDAALLVKN